MRVLDASAFVHDYSTDDRTASIPAVSDELTGETAYRFEAEEGAGMRVYVPADETEARVRRAASETGDDGALSRTDRRLVAAALELGAVLVTDDYAVQNVAAQMEVETEVIARDGIDERRDWRFQCRGCGREFDDDRGRCPVCGSDLTRKNPA
jgi:UPF0271 protein